MLGGLGNIGMGKTTVVSKSVSLNVYWRVELHCSSARYRKDRPTNYNKGTIDVSWTSIEMFQLEPLILTKIESKQVNANKYAISIYDRAMCYTVYPRA